MTNKSRKALLVYPEFRNSYWGFQYALPLFGRKSMHSPLSLCTVAALLPPTWEIELVDMNVEPLTDAHIERAEIVLTTGMGIQSTSMYQVLERARKMGKLTVLGGPFASGSTDRVEGKADVMVLDEGELTIAPFLEDLERGTLKKVYRSEAKPDLSMSPVPRFDLIKLNKYSVIDIQYSRGCPFNCEFCDIIELYGRVPRTKSPAQLLAEFDALLALGYRGAVFLVDDNFIGNKKNVRLMMPELIAWQERNDYPFFISTEASVNLAEDAPLLADMRRAGFTRVFVGIETPSLDSLKETQKYQNTRKDLASAVHDIQEAGMEVLAGFIVGFDNDTPDIFDAQIEFITQATIPWAMVGTLTAIPNTQLWRRLAKENRLTGFTEGDQFGRPNFRTRMDPDVLYTGFLRILRSIYEPEAYYGRMLRMMDRQDAAGHITRTRTETPFKIFQLLLLCSVVMGIKSDYRGVFWRSLAHVVTRYPKRLAQFLISCVTGHHFIRYTAEVMQREAALQQREAAPKVLESAA